MNSNTLLVFMLHAAMWQCLKRQNERAFVTHLLAVAPKDQNEWFYAGARKLMLLLKSGLFTDSEWRNEKVMHQSGAAIRREAHLISNVIDVTAELCLTCM